MSKKNNAPQKKNRSVLFTASFIGIIFCTVFGVFGNLQRYQNLQREKVSIENQIREQEQLQLSNEMQKEYLHSDVYIEQIAREQLGMVKPNEVLYVEQNQ